jgi:hypothetical protein
MKKTILYAAGAVLSFLLFYSIIPLDIYDNFFYFLIIVGGAATALCVGGFIFNLEYAKNSGDNSNFGCLGIAAILAVFFGSSFLFLFHEGEREKNELLKYGVYTNATVVDGSSYKTRKADFTSIKLEFTTEKGQQFRTNYSVDAGEFDKFYQSQTIPIVYSPRYPQIVKIFRTSTDLQQYMDEKAKYHP